jgi:hypothetical protein
MEEKEIPVVVNGQPNTNVLSIVEDQKDFHKNNTVNMEEEKERQKIKDQNVKNKIEYI